MNAYRRIIVIFTAALIFTLAAACAGQPGSGLNGAQPTPGSKVPGTGQGQPLNTTPHSLIRKDASGASLAFDFYPAPQPGKGALLLVLGSGQELGAWRLLAQSAQVKGLAAVVLDLQNSGKPSQAIQAVVQFLAAPENGGNNRIVAAGSGSSIGPALASLAPEAEIKGFMVFSPQAENLGDGANGRPVLVVESSSIGAANGGSSVELRIVPGGGQGVEGILPQPGVIDQLLDWCLGRLAG